MEAPGVASDWYDVTQDKWKGKGMHTLLCTTLRFFTMLFANAMSSELSECASSLLEAGTEAFRFSCDS